MRTPTVRKQYSDAEITRALETLRANDYNLKKTSREVGISRDTIRRWQKEYDRPPGEPTDVTPAEVIDTTIEKWHQLDEAITKAIARTLDLIPQCKSAIEASTVAKNLARIKLDLQSGRAEITEQEKHHNILQTTINILNKYNY